MTAPSGSAPALPETYRDCLDFLFARNQFSIKLGLETINALLDRLGRPDAGMTFLHVAGTNGKGSVCANLAALLGAAGYRRVGLYTSPSSGQLSGAHPGGWRTRTRRLDRRVDARGHAGHPGAQRHLLRMRHGHGPRLFPVPRLPGRGFGNGIGRTPGRHQRGGIGPDRDHLHFPGPHVHIWAIRWRRSGARRSPSSSPGVPMVVMEDRPHLLAELEAMAASKGSPVIKLGDFPMAMGGTAEPEGNGESLEFHGRYATYKLPGSLRPEAHQRANLALSLLAMETFLGRCPDRPVPAFGGCARPGPARLPRARPHPAPGGSGHASGPVGRGPQSGRHGRPGSLSAARLSRANASWPCSRSCATRTWRACTQAYADSPRGFCSCPWTGSSPGRCLIQIWKRNWQARSPLRYRCRLPNSCPLDAGALEALLRDGKGGFDLAVFCGSLYLLGEVIPMLLPHYRGLEWFRQFQGEVC